MNVQVGIRDLVGPHLTRLTKAISPEAMQRMWTAVGAAIVFRAQRAFTEPSLRPAPWLPLSPRTLAARKARGRKGTAILLDSGDLRRSPRVVSVDERSVAIGSHRRVGMYSLAAIHQLGAPRACIPARPFFPFTGNPPVLSPAAIAEIQAIIRRHILSETRSPYGP